MRLLSLFLVWTGAVAAGEWHFSAPYGGSATAIDADPARPERLLAGTHSSLIFLSADAGAHWRALPFPRHFLGAIRVVRFDPLDSRHLLAGVQLSGSPHAGLYESRDDGQHWQQTPALRGISVEALTIWSTDARRWIAATRNGAYQTTDSGTTWSRITPAASDELRAITSVAIDPASPAVIYAGTPHLPWKTLDGGTTWNPMHAGMIDDSDVMSIAIDSRFPQRLYASACSGIYHSETQGSRWAKYGGLSDDQRRTHVIRQDPDNPQILYAGTTAGLLKSINGGIFWRQVNHYEINGLVIDTQNPAIVYLATERAGIVKSTDRGETFADANDGFLNRGLVSLAVGAGKTKWLLARPNEHESALYSSPGAAEWRPAGATPVRTGVNSALASLGPTLLYAEEDSVRRSIDDGRTWQTVLPSRSDPARTQISALQAVAGGFLVSTPTTIRHSTDGLTWTTVQTMRPVNQAKLFFGSPASAQVAALTPGGALLSPDGGRHWRNVLLPPGAGTPNMLAYAEDGATVYLAASSGLFRSADAGQTWRRAERGLPGGSVSHVLTLPELPANAVAISFGAVYRTRDAGATWTLEAPSPVPAVRLQWISVQRSDTVRLYGLTADTGLIDLELVP